MRRTSHLLAMVIIATLAPERCEASDLHVPSGYPTIQGAIDAAAAGDRVLVGPGIYFEQIDYLAKEITVESTDGAAVTILDGSLLDDTIVFIGCSFSAVLRGFTLQNGGIPGNTSPDVLGGAVYACGGVTIEDNIFLDNAAQFGGALYVNGGVNCLPESFIRRNVFQGNLAWEGGGAFLDTHCVHVEGNIFRENTAIDSPPPPGFDPRGHGGAIALTAGGGVFIRDNLFLGNSAQNVWEVGQGGAIWSQFGPQPFIVEGNSFIANTTQLWGSFLHYPGPSGVPFRNCLIWGNTLTVTQGYDEVQELTFMANSVEYTLVLGGFPGIGNIDADPALVYDAQGLPHLSHIATGQAFDSPCVDAGDPGSAIPPGGWTRLDGVPDAGVIDIGFHHRPSNPWHFVRGDCGRDGVLDISDAILSLEVLFVLGSPAPTCTDACDSNDDGTVNIADPITVLVALFAGGAAPPSPYPSCGPDPTADQLGCAPDPSCP